MTITDIEQFAIRKGLIKPEPCKYHVNKSGRRWGAQIAFVRDLLKRRKQICHHDLPMIPQREKMLSWMLQHGELKVVGYHKQPHTTGTAYRIYAPTKFLVNPSRPVAGSSIKTAGLRNKRVG